MKKMHIYGLRLLATSMAGLLSSCISDADILGKDEVAETESEFRFGTRTPGTEPGDDTIISLRMMIFEAGNDYLADNVLIDTGNELQNTPFTHSIAPGSYHFFFVANEPGEYTEELNGVRWMDDLNDIAFSEEHITAERLIPMLRDFTSDDMIVRVADDGVKVGSDDPTIDWHLKLLRMGVRIDATLTSGSDVSSSFTGLRFSNLPDLVPLTKNYTGTVTRGGVRSFTLEDDPEYFEPVPEAGMETTDAWGQKLTRVILPANDFSPVGVPDKAISLSLLSSIPNSFPVCTLGYDTRGKGGNGQNFSLPLNTRLLITGDIAMPVELGGLTLGVETWEPSEVNGDGGETRWLNVSEIAGNVSASKSALVTFSSNQPDVKIRATCRVAGGSVVDVEGLFIVSQSYIWGEGPTASGSATIQPTGATPGTTYILYLDAGGREDYEPLTREIEVRVE